MAKKYRWNIATCCLKSGVLQRLTNVPYLFTEISAFTNLEIFQYTTDTPHWFLSVPAVFSNHQITQILQSEEAKKVPRGASRQKRSRNQHRDTPQILTPCGMSKWALGTDKSRAFSDERVWDGSPYRASMHDSLSNTGAPRRDSRLLVCVEDLLNEDVCCEE